MRTVRLDGSYCKTARAQLALTREALERKSGISAATIKRAERGSPVLLETVRTLAKALGQPIERLLRNVERVEGDHLRVEGNHLRVEGDHPPLEAPRKPASVAVLPFKVIGSGAEGAHFADGLVEDLIHRVGRSLFPVISAESTLGESARTLPHDELVRGLGADYLIVGSAQQAGQRVRVTARVVRARDGHVLASEQYDQPYVDLFAAQSELAARIVEQVGHLLMQSESQAVMSREPSNLSAWELGVRGSLHFYAGTAASNADARRFFERAVTKDPSLMLVWYSLAMTHQRDIVNQWSVDPECSLSHMRQVYAEFQRHHPREPWLGIVAGYVSVYSGERAAAMAWLEDAIQSNPNAAAAHSLYGQTLAMANEPDRAIAEFETALRIGPLDSERWSVYTALALAHFVAERYEETVGWARKATTLRPNVPFPHGTLAAALAHLGCVPEARQELSLMLELAPSATMKGMATLVASTNQDIARRYQAGLRVAGLAS